MSAQCGDVGVVELCRLRKGHEGMHHGHYHAWHTTDAEQKRRAEIRRDMRRELRGMKVESK